MSLDAFRGLTIIGMLLVNNVALDTATPRHFQHASWNAGVHFADLVFPWFLFIVGIAIPYAAASHRRKGLAMWRFDLKALSRMVILVGLGLLIDCSISKTLVFQLGVLQLIGMAYFAGAVLYILPAPWRATLAAVLLLGYWAIIKFVPVPGIGAGVFSESANIIKHINDTVLAAYHLSGLMSLIPTSALVLLGSLGGDFLRRDQEREWRKPLYLAIGGVVLAAMGWAWNLNLPFNKPVWTPSYILYTAGLGAVVLGAMYAIIDVKQWKAWAFPLVVYGMNAIVAYVAPILVKVHVLQEWQWQMPDGTSLSLQQAFLRYCVEHAGAVGGGWIYTISYLGFWWLIMLWLYKKKIFLRV